MTGLFDGLPDAFTGAFGEPVKLIPQIGAIRDLRGIFKFAMVEDMGAIYREPVLHIRAVDAAGAGVGSEVIIGYDRYKIRQSEPDGMGMIVLRLERV